MDLALKFIEENNTYEIDEYFYGRLSTYSLEDAGNVIAQVLSVINYLPTKSGWAQEVAGVILKDEPIFFVVEFLHQENEIPVLVDLSYIDVDEYLDFISNQKSIKSYNDAYRKNGNANQESSGV